jgi:hypothetical protein
MHFLTIFSVGQLSANCDVLWQYCGHWSPLALHSYHETQLCVLLILESWIVSALHSVVQTLLFLRLSTCAHSKIPHFFSELNQVIHSACSDSFLNDLIIYSASVLLVCFLLALRSTSPSEQSHQLKGSTKHFPPVCLTCPLTSYFIAQSWECTSVLFWPQTHIPLQHPQWCTTWSPHAEPFHLQPQEQRHQ